MTEDKIIEWMRSKISTGQYTDAASLARAFLDHYDIKNTNDPNFTMTIDAGFKLADEIAQAKKEKPEQQNN
jgi:hypothetical protein